MHTTMPLFRSVIHFTHDHQPSSEIRYKSPANYRHGRCPRPQLFHYDPIMLRHIIAQRLLQVYNILINKAFYVIKHLTEVGL